MRSRRTAVYRCYGASDQLLYIGATADIAVRMRAHERVRSEWPQVKRVDAVWYETRAEALAAESSAIASELPAWNRRDIPDWRPTHKGRLSTEVFMTTGEVGELLGRNRWQVITMVKTGRLKATTVPGSKHRRILRTVAEAYRDKMAKEAGGSA